MEKDSTKKPDGTSDDSGNGSSGDNQNQNNSNTDQGSQSQSNHITPEQADFYRSQGRKEGIDSLRKEYEEKERLKIETAEQSEKELIFKKISEDKAYEEKFNKAFPDAKSMPLDQLKGIMAFSSAESDSNNGSETVPSDRLHQGTPGPVSDADIIKTTAAKVRAAGLKKGGN